MSRVVYVLKDLDQATAPRHTRQGSLTSSVNTRQTKSGPRRKRRGFARATVSTFKFALGADDDDSSPNATMQELSPGGQLFRDASDNIWAQRSSAAGLAYFRGEHRRCGVTSTNTGFPAHKTIKPMSINVSTHQVWHFALQGGDTSSDPTAQPSYNTFWLTIEDKLVTEEASSIARGPFYFVDATGNSIANYSAVYHSVQNKVYVFTVYRDDSVRCFSISAAPGNLGDVVDLPGDFHTDADAKWNSVDAIYDTALNQVLVAYSSWNEDETITAKIRHGKLDTATVTEDDGTFAENFDPGITGAFLCSGVSWLVGQPFSDGKARYVCWVKGSATQDVLLLVQYTVDTSDMSVPVDNVVYSGTSTRYELEHAGVCSGYFDQATGKSIILSQIMYPSIADEETSQPLGVGCARNAKIERLQFNPVGPDIDVDPFTAVFGGWLASKPFQGADSKWYVLTGVDSGSDGLQRAYHVRRIDVGFLRAPPDSCRIVGQIFWPDAAFMGHRWRGQIAASPETIDNSWGWAPGVAQQTAGCKVALGRTGETPQSLTTHAVTIDFAAAFSRGVEIYDDLVLYPGSVPTVAGPRDMAHDLAPLLFPVAPPRVTAAGSSSALGAVFATISYRFRDSSGRITPSTHYPVPATLAFNSSGTRTVALRCLNHIGHGTVEIEFWATVPGGEALHLQSVLANDPTTFEISVNVDPAKFRSDTETLRYAGDGIVLPNPPPPCRLADMFAERLILSGTPVEGEFLYSQPFDAGFGPEFNIEALAQIWIGQGPINAISPVDLNSFAFARPAQIGVIQGSGPAPAGGAYGTVLEINSGNRGVRASATRGHAMLRTPFGPVFQDAQSGRLCIVMPGLKVDELPPGLEDTIRASKLVAGGEQSGEGTIWFQLASGAIAVLDVRHPDESESSRWGNWHLWTSSALTESASVGLVERDGGPLWLQANGSWRTYKASGQLFQDTNAASAQVDVLESMSTLLLPDGLHGEVLVSDLNVIGTHLSASSVRFTTTDDAGTAENHDVTLSTPFNYAWRPGNLLRVQEFVLTIAEQAGSTGEGFDLDSVGIEFQPAGRMKRLATTRIV